MKVVFSGCILKKGDYSLIGEVKNRKTTKFSLNEAEEFLEKAKELIEIEGIEKHVLFVFCSAGFTLEAPDYFKANNIAWAEDSRWIESRF